MPAYEAPLVTGGVGGSRSGRPLLDQSFLESMPPRWLILRRGEERMVLFRGWPEPPIVEAFQQLHLTIGLALTADDFAGQGRLEVCGYAFIGACGRAKSAFADALRDLARINWSIDHDASWPVIVSHGGAHGGLSKQQRIRKVEA